MTNRLLPPVPGTLYQLIRCCVVFPYSPTTDRCGIGVDAEIDSVMMVLRPYRNDERWTVVLFQDRLWVVATQELTNRIPNQGPQQ